MYKNSTTYFNNTLETDEAEIIYKEFEKAKCDGNNSAVAKNYNSIVKNMKLRVENNYISPMKEIIRITAKTSTPENVGFISMGVCCILIELLYELKHGYDTSDEGGNCRNAYEEILPLMDYRITNAMAKMFYKGIRCGIIHQGQTKEKIAITFETTSIMEKCGKLYLCNPTILFEKLKEQYKEYWDEVSRSSYHETPGKNLCDKFGLILGHLKK